MTASEITTFGALLRRFRLAASLSQEALAERAQLSVAAVTALERGHRTAPRPETVGLLAGALGLSLDERAALIAAAVAARTRGADPLPDLLLPLPAAPAVAFPIPPTPLIGREREEAAVTHLLRPGGTRVLTLTGPGGVGKTRLALAVAAVLRDAYPDGAVFVDLSALRDPELVAPAVAQALGLREEGAQGARALLLAHLCTKHMLLLLDNFEQVVEAAPLVGELAASCPRLTLLVTSRTALRVRAEQRFGVPPLAVPAPWPTDSPLPAGGPAETHPAGTTGLAPGQPSVDEVENYAAVRLFVARARAVQPDFVLDAANVGVVAELCRRLDGVPLAIELAAVRLQLLPPATLLRRLERRLALLSGGSRDLPDRQQTLRATIDWSYALLPEWEQALFRRLSIFAGGCTLDAAEHVALFAGMAGGDVLAGMEILVDHSLLQSMGQQEGEPRFRMLETIREYGLEQLAARGEAAEARERQAGFFLALAEAADPHLRSGRRKVWLRRLDHDSDNLRAALVWSTEEPGHAALGLRLAAALTWFWRFYERLHEGRSWLETMLARADGTGPSAVRAKSLYGVGMLAWYQGDLAGASAPTEAGVSLFRQHGDKEGLATALRLLGLIRMGEGTPAAARPLLEESRALFHDLGDRWGEAMTLYRLGLADTEAGDPAARACYEQSLALFRQVGDPLGVAVVLNALAVAAAAHGDDATALSLITESLPLARQAPDRWDLARLLINAGTLWLRRGEQQQAQDLFVESLRLWREIGHQAGIALSLAGLGGVAAARGQPERAGRLFGAARTLFPPTDPFVTAASGADLDQRSAAARAALDAAAFDAAWAAGQTLALDEAIGEALGDHV